MEVIGSYNVVVVEDEPLMLKSIIQKIENIYPAFKVINNAFNGRDAITILKSTKVDVLFTDIKMPIMDGLELIKFVKINHPDIHVVILSGYNEFDFAQQAIKWGVKDYLLKPLQTEALFETLENIETILQVKQYALEKDMLDSKINGIPVVYQAPTSFCGSNFFPFLICIGNLYNHITSDIQSDKLNYQWSKLQWDQIVMHFQNKNLKWWLLDGKLPNEKLLICASNHVSPDDINNISQLLFRTLKELVSPFTLNICFDYSFVTLNALKDLVHQLRVILDQELIIGHSSLITPKSIRKTDLLKSSIDINTRNSIVAFIQSGNKVMLKNLLQHILSDWEVSMLPQRLVERCLHDIISIFHHESLSISEAELFHLEYELYERLPESNSLKDFYTVMWKVLESIMIGSPSENKDSNKIPFQIEDYIKLNFTKSLSIEDISKRFNFDSSYLIKIFKKYKNETPLQYLIALRIEEAKRLIQNQPDLDIKKVGELIGYQDQHYFSRIFKNVTNLSPTEFREEITKE